jgi:hypothetical protein
VELHAAHSVAVAVVVVVLGVDASLARVVANRVGVTLLRGFR